MKSRPTSDIQDNSSPALTEGNILEGNFWPEPVYVIALKKSSGIEYQE
jgi:hypothetical protein